MVPSARYKRRLRSFRSRLQFSSSSRKKRKHNRSTDTDESSGTVTPADTDRTLTALPRAGATTTSQQRNTSTKLPKHRRKRAVRSLKRLGHAISPRHLKRFVAKLSIKLMPGKIVKNTKARRKPQMMLTNMGRHQTMSTGSWQQVSRNDKMEREFVNFAGL